MADKKRGGGVPVSAGGHREEAQLATLDVAFDVETLFQQSDEMRDDLRRMARAWSIQRRALQNMADGLARVSKHTREAVRIEQKAAA
jgi:hypothetical protein